ncbi:Repressor of filamentous growth 1 [Colletotrichum orbiculare MAFF 240422]|uniref:Repressor of filamentous growth 1 n=1 Tax=Colletotrichum orbiculare (strain 104-T / ATCC 96160 / CBS 514.97 / LARS 414 / MAFF 240422) TaxID=1213857 RepID=N4W2W0_COLOR|nr:Repressor of filamentous growth 1 [Colletotrichum orbiculare MAFF 240422]
MERRASHEDDRPDSVGSAGSRANKKRAASIDVEEANSSSRQQGDYSSETGPMGGEGSKDYICLCTPALKVPRPRNAFILYRQHHQAQVIAQHPGLSNPEISKIIGEQWRIQPEDVKESWKKLAEEEKIRHQRQYPDYRYQPRRGGRPGSRAGSASGGDTGRCNKCGGRFIATPRTPSTPYGTPTAAKSNMAPHPRDMRGGDNEQLRHALPGGKQPYQYQHGNLRDVEEEYEPMSPSPELKRRRFNQMGHYQAVPSPGPYTGHPLSRQPRSSLSMPQTPPIGGFGPLPGPSALARPGHGAMAPPPRPHPSYAGPSRGSAFDESLRLPPLQTQTSPPLNRESDLSDRPSAHPATGLGIANPRDTYAQSLEAMIMTIPFLSKLKVLQKISPTLAPPGPASPDIETRGAVIAVEGADPRQVEQVGTSIHRSLLGLNEIDLKIWTDSPNTPLSVTSADDDARLNDAASVASSRKSSHSQPSVHASELFSSYMQTMMKWHEKSREIVRHITTKPSFGPDGHPPGRRASDGEIVGVSHHSMSAPVPTKTPIALLPAGFSLTISDKYACMIPIADSYAPVDHWQWMSTLWRGVIGPDLVIYVKAVAEEEVTRGGAVEFRGPGVMVVRIAHGKSLDEKTERRVCFELVEWIRGASFQEGFGRGDQM